MDTFTVDTKLFRELGELLVGRESTALVELIKNAYDADATTVNVHAVGLTRSGEGVIIVLDNGTGMTAQEFRNGFLRIAGRTKSELVPRSPYFDRRYTGEKGIGRLAAHKLAALINVTSRRWSGRPRDDLTGFPADSGVEASIDWTTIESLETLGQVAESGAIFVRQIPSGDARKLRAGTTLRLERTRKEWTNRDLDRFFEEVATLVPPSSLVDQLPTTIVKGTLLFAVPKVRDQGKAGGFEVGFSGDLALRESELIATAESAHWVIELDCDASRRQIRLSVEPTVRGRSEYPNASGFHMRQKLDTAAQASSFQARIFQRSRQSWPAAYRGVRVYHEGFRVLPYGDPTNDWLGLERDYRSRRTGELGRLQNYSKWSLPSGDPGEGMVIQGNNAFYGAVFLTRDGAKDLKMLINREGFLPSPQFDFMADMIRLGLDLHVRLQYAATTEIRHARKQSSERQRNAVERANADQPPSAFLLDTIQREAVESLRVARAALAAGRSEETKQALAILETKISAAREISGEAASEATVFRVLASMGLEQAAFTHEVNSLALTAQRVVHALDNIAATCPPAIKRRLNSLSTVVKELRERLRRNAIYLADVTGVEGRRRRSRQLLAARFDAAAEFFKPMAEKRSITIANNLPPRVQTPPMFPAELTSIIGNLLSNSIKFAGQNGRIQATGRATEELIEFTIENTGAAVDLRSADRWFEPFRSTTSEVDAALGQGMGLGLTITRSLIDEYGGQIRFTPPTRGFATAITVILPVRR
jgi:signal transduction histidine kinase